MASYTSNHHTVVHSENFCKDRWKDKVTRLKSRFSTPSLSLFDDNMTESLISKTEALSLSLPSGQNADKIRERVKSFGNDFKRIRSKSCERVFQRCKKGLDKVVKKEDPVPVDYFQHSSATLRQSRRTRTRKARPSKRTYTRYARAVMDVNPSPYDTEALTLRVGDLIGIISQHPSGIWTGESEGKVGRFKFINVELVEPEVETDKEGKCSVSEEAGDAASVSDLLVRLGLAHLTSKLVLNGYDKLESLDSVTKVDLQYLGISDSEEQSKIVMAAMSLSKGDIKTNDSPDRLDSGCFDCGSGDDTPSSGSVERRHLGVSRRTVHHSSLPASDSWSHYMTDDVSDVLF